MRSAPSPQKWRIIGNHQGTVVADPDNAANNVLDLVATGATDHEGNNAGTTFVGNTAIVNGTTYQISFKARWVGGIEPAECPCLSESRQRHVLLGLLRRTAARPGAQNSTFVANVGPTYSDFQHGPVLPAADSAVTVSVRAADPDGVASMTLFWSLDGGSWNSVAMIAGADGLYTGVVPGQAAGNSRAVLRPQGKMPWARFRRIPAAGPIRGPCIR